MSRPSAYPWELRERAVRMVAEIRPNYESEYAAITAVATKLDPQCYHGSTVECSLVSAYALSYR
jgi:hypothetical protein